MPWHTSGKFAFSPINVTSKKPYRGIKTVCLWAAAQAKGYERGGWGTYQQWHERGAQVRKGEKATLVVFWKFANSAAETNDGDTPQPGSRLLFTLGLTGTQLQSLTLIHPSSSALNVPSSRSGHRYGCAVWRCTRGAWGRRMKAAIYARVSTSDQNCEMHCGNCGSMPTDADGKSQESTWTAPGVERRQAGRN